MYSLALASVLFLLARSGRKTDGHKINIRMFIMFLCFFLHRQGLNTHAVPQVDTSLESVMQGLHSESL